LFEKSAIILLLVPTMSWCRISVGYILCVALGRIKFYPAGNQFDVIQTFTN
jgi:hypothetical protein